MLFKLAVQSLRSRRSSVILTIIALTISIALLFLVEHIRVQAKQSFQRTVSGVDLVVAARSSQINVLLSAVFGVGANSNSISWQSYQTWKNDQRVKWTIPMSLGDSHRGYAVIGTQNTYFDNYKYGSNRSLEFAQGAKITYAYDLVLGAAVARDLHYEVGDFITLSHGLGEVSFSHHHDFPFYVSGILEQTGTPVDKSLYVDISAIEAIHKPHASSGARPAAISSLTPKPSSEHHNHDSEHEHKNEKTYDLHDAHNESNEGGQEHHEHGDSHQMSAHNDDHDHDHDHDHDSHSHDDGHDSDRHNSHPSHKRSTQSINSLAEPTQISSFLLGLNSRIAVLTMQRDINQYKAEAMSAIIPGVALAELWQLLASVENVLLLMSALMFISALFGLATMMLASMRERLQEFKVLRIVGAQPKFIFILIQTEIISIMLVSQILAFILVTGFLSVFGNYLATSFSITLEATIVSANLVGIIFVMLGFAFVLGLLPAIRAYRVAANSTF